MIGRLRSYGLVLRTAMYVLPLIAFVLAGYVRAKFIKDGIGFSRNEILYLALFTTTVWAVVAERQKVTSIGKVSAENTGIKAALAASGITYVVILIALFVIHQFNFSRSYIILSALFLFILTAVVRSLFRVLISQFAELKAPMRLLVVGVGRAAAAAATQLERNEFVRCRVVGYIRLRGEEIQVADAPVFRLGETERIESANPESIVIALSPEQLGDFGLCIRKLRRLSKPIRVIVDVHSRLLVRDRVEQIGRLQMLDVDPGPTWSFQYHYAKRAFDLLFSSCALLVFGLPMGLVALAVKASSPGPVLFRQRRVGRNGKLFTMYKFRTMKMASSSDGDTQWTTQSDPRRTRLGTFLRRTSLDELPQFLNVLMGEMSVVGPRPERPHFVREFRNNIASYDTRHYVNVGMTGWAQVNGLRGDTSISKRIQYDLYYLQHWTLQFDLKIIWLTLFGGFAGKNAY
jgi:Undecaprenyl-phosphate glucose phosphotransferase